MNGEWKVGDRKGEVRDWEDTENGDKVVINEDDEEEDDEIWNLLLFVFVFAFDWPFWSVFLDLLSLLEDFCVSELVFCLFLLFFFESAF